MDWAAPRAFRRSILTKACRQLRARRRAARNSPHDRRPDGRLIMARAARLAGNHRTSSYPVSRQDDGRLDRIRAGSRTQRRALGERPRLQIKGLFVSANDAHYAAMRRIAKARRGPPYRRADRQGNSRGSGKMIRPPVEPRAVFTCTDDWSLGKSSRTAANVLTFPRRRRTGLSGAARSADSTPFAQSCLLLRYVFSYKTLPAGVAVGAGRRTRQRWSHNHHSPYAIAQLERDPGHARQPNPSVSQLL